MTDPINRDTTTGASTSGANCETMTIDGNGVDAEPLLPEWVAQYRHDRQQALPEVVVFDVDSNESKIIKSLCNFFKCTKYLGSKDPNTSDESDEEVATKARKCFATRNTALQFDIHLTKCHPTDQLCCIYCSQIPSNQTALKYYKHKYLIKHMLKRHLFRRFQCSHCLYRAVTEDHLFVHQETKHAQQFRKAIDGCKEDSASKVFICQLMDTTPNIEKPSRSLYHYYRKLKVQRLNSEGMNETLYQCLYCLFMNEVLRQVVEHCVEKHPDFPILYYVPEPQVTSSSAATATHKMDAIIAFDATIVKPKLEPQDNSVSSTQKTIHTNSAAVRRGPESDEQSDQHSKRPKVNVAIAVKEPHPKATTVSLSSGRENYRICLFCDQTYNDSNSAKSHIETHFGESGTSGMVIHWIQRFLLKQWELCSYEDNDKNQSSHFYSCPLCERLAKLTKRVAKRYQKFPEIMNHLWQHCCWLSVKCKLCKQMVPNCDSFIAKHLNESHNHFTIECDFLATCQTNTTFTDNEWETLQKKFIDVNSNKTIESHIRRLLEQVKDDFERQLTAKTKTTELIVCKKRMREDVFERYYNIYKEYEKNKKKQMSAKLCDKICDDNAVTLAKAFNDLKKASSKSRGRPKADKSAKRSDAKKAAKADPKKSNKTSDSGEKIDSLLGDINSVDKELSRRSDEPIGEQSTSVPMPSISGRGVEKTNESVTTEDEGQRIVCYHCSDRFTSKRAFNEHSREKHRGKVARCFAKPLSRT